MTVSGSATALGGGTDVTIASPALDPCAVILVLLADMQADALAVPAPSGASPASSKGGSLDFYA